MLFFIDCQEMSAVTVFNQLAVWNLNIFEHFQLVIDYSKYLKARRKGHSDKQTTRMLNYNKKYH